MRYTVKTKLNAEKAYEKAIAYFGPKGAGLDLEEGTSGCCAHFKTDLGYVHIEIGQEGKTTTLDLETKEYDIQVREFMKGLNK